MSDLRLGRIGPEVGNWQRFLNRVFLNRPYAGSQIIIVDENFGPKTRSSTINYQILEDLDKSGIVDLLTRKRALEEGFIPFVQAKNFTSLTHEQCPRSVDLIVIHTMESPDKPNTAENVSAWFASAFTPQASAHYCVDIDSVVQCVRDSDVAWHAPGANRNGIGIEHSGYAKQSVEDWKNPYNQAMLLRSAKLASSLCKEYNIPIEHPSIDELKNRAKGICGHVDITNAFNNGKGHTDPGPNFPWDQYLDLVRNN